MSGIRLWNGDICDLEVDAIVVPTTTTLWMTSGAALRLADQMGLQTVAFLALGSPLDATGTAADAPPRSWDRS